MDSQTQKTTGKSEMAGGTVGDCSTWFMLDFPTSLGKIGTLRISWGNLLVQRRGYPCGLLQRKEVLYSLHTAVEGFSWVRIVHESRGGSSGYIGAEKEKGEAAKPSTVGAVALSLERPTDTELQLKSLKKILIAWRAWSSYETCFVISFLINHKTGSAVRRCLPD